MNLSPLAIQKFFDNAGKPLVGGQLFTYVAGTSTKIATYKDETGGSTNTNPIVLDYRGEAHVWLDQTLTYKFVLAPEGDTDPPTRPIWTVDQISAAITYASLTQQIIGQIFYPKSPAEFTAGAAVIDYFQYYGDIRRYGAVGDNLTDCTTAIQAAINVMEVDGGLVRIPEGIFRFTSKLVISAVAVITVRGDSWGSSILRKAFSGTGLEITSSATPVLENFSIDRTGADAGVGLLLTAAGNHTVLRQFQSFGHGSHGIEHIEGNLVTYDTILALSNGGDGIKLNGATTPDVNACTFVNIDARGNTGWGMNFNNAWANFGVGITTQSNTAGGVRLNNARQNCLQIYSESNGGPQVELVNTVDCKGNIITVLEGTTTFGGSTSTANMVTNTKRGAVFDPNYQKVTSNRFILPSELQDGTAVPGTLDVSHTTSGVYDFAHSGLNATAESRFTHSNGAFKHIVTCDAALLKKAASNSGAGAVMLGSTTALTVGAAGGAAALPATPLGFWNINVNGSDVKVPYYNP